MSLKGQRTKSDYLEWDSLMLLIQKLERDNQERFALLISIGAFTGLRVSDVLCLTWKDLINQESIELEEKKTKKARVIQLNSQLVEIVDRVYSDEPLEQLIFLNRFGTRSITVQYVNRKLKVLFDFYGINGSYSSHFWRKSLGRRVWEQNNHSEKSLIMLGELFNHSSIRTTKIYLGIRQEEIGNIYLGL